jgi:hypothetical protein
MGEHSHQGPVSSHVRGPATPADRRANRKDHA